MQQTDSKLSWTEKVAIFNCLRDENPPTKTALAKEYDVSRSTITRAYVEVDAKHRQDVQTSDEVPDENVAVAFDPCSIKVIITPDCIAIQVVGQDPQIVQSNHQSFDAIIEAIEAEDFERAAEVRDKLKAVRETMSVTNE